MRNNRFTVLFTDQERQILKKLASSSYRSESSMIRSLIYQALSIYSSSLSISENNDSKNEKREIDANE
ncbi:MAG: hypothetical protein WCK35_12780 [Chloroflexota bacterium]